jgi:hypothetical protein
MKRLTLPILLAGVLVIALVLAWTTLSHASWWRRVASPASEATVSVERPVSAFSTISVEGVANVELVQGSKPSVVVEAPQALQQTVVIDNHGDTLILRSGSGSSGWQNWFGANPRPTPKVTVTFTELSRIEASGGLRLSAHKIEVPKLAIDVSGAAAVTIADLATDDLRIDGSGAMKADIAGRATAQRIEISGAGDYHAPRLVSETARVGVSGAGRVLVNATRTLSIDLSGAGIVDYTGNPVVTKSVSGLGQVRQMNTALDTAPDTSPRPSAAIHVEARPPDASSRTASRHVAL